MSLDLFERETRERVETQPGFERPEPGAWDGYLRGSGAHAMEGFAKAARAMSMGGALGPILYDKFTDGTEAQDRFFKAHDDIFRRAVDYWTPTPGEVGVAGQVTGQLLSLLPLVIASPAGAVATTQLSVAEDLVAKGVDPAKAQAVGAAYGTGIGLGIWVPILGRTLPQRMLLGGAGFNLTQGIVMRGAAGEILEGTPAEGSFLPLNPTDLTIDAILGLAFGGIAHLSPAARAQGEAFWRRVDAWRQNLTPEQIEALGSVRQAQHAAADSFPGKPTTPEAVDAHVERVRAAVDQLVRDQPVNVADMPPVASAPDPARLAASAARAAELVESARTVRTEEGLPPPPEVSRETGRFADIYRAEPEAQPRAIGQAVEQALLEMQHPPEEARANASIWEAFFRTASERYAVPAARILEQYGVDIRRLGDLEEPEGALAQPRLPVTAAERAPKVARIKQLREQIKILADKGGLTAAEAETYKRLNMEASSLMFDLARPLAIEKIPSETERQSTLPATTVLLARDAMIGNKDIYDALVESAIGVHFNRTTPIDEIMLGRNPKVSAQQLYAAFEPVRQALRQQHGNTITLYRATGRQIEKPTTNWATTREFAAQFGDTVITRDVPINEVLAVTVGLNGSYHEVIVGKPSARTYFQPLLQSLPGQPRFYSELQRQLEAVKQESATPEQWKGMVQNLKGVRRAEVEWSGLNEWLDLRREQAEQSKKWAQARAIEEPEGGDRAGMWVVVDEDGNTVTNTRWVDEDGAEFAAKAIRERPTVGDKISRQEVLDFIAGNAVRGPLAGRRMSIVEMDADERVPQPVRDLAQQITAIREDPRSTEAARPTKFGQYQLPGGENYRELLITLPERTPPAMRRELEVRAARAGDGWAVWEGDQQVTGGALTRNAATLEMGRLQMEATRPKPGEPGFTAGHFEEPNVLAHVRFNERTDPEGKRVLFLEEIQSDWAQKGKREGFIIDPDRITAAKQRDADLSARLQELRKIFWDGNWTKPLEDEETALLRERDILRDEIHAVGRVPPAPFVGKTEAWVALGLKRMIAWAIENGFDRVAWTTGEQQVSRYTSALRKAVDLIEWKKTDQGVHLVGYKGVPRRPGETGLKQKVVDTTEKEDALSDAIGKSMADRILGDPAQEGTIEGANIRVDDTGMGSFYNRILPNVANDILKKLGGGRVKEVGIDIAPRDADETRARIEQLNEAPRFEDLSSLSRETYQGTDDFPDGDPPLVGETTIRLWQTETASVDMPVEVVIDPSGVHVIGENFEFFLAKPRTRTTQSEALDWVSRNWGSAGFWAAMELITGELPGIPGAAARSTQQGFDITPRMIERAKQGLPLFQAGRGQIQFGDGQTVIGLFENADASTFLHETGHFFLQVTRDLANRPTAPAQALRDWGTLATWLKNEGGEITREQHEQFARGFELYLAEGKAPTQGLARVFEQFKQWLLAIYHSLTELDVNLTDEVRGVMDRMLGAQKAEGPAGQVTAREPPPPRAGKQPAGPAAQRREDQPSALLRDIREAGGISNADLEEITGERRFGKTKGLPWGVFRRQKKDRIGQIIEGHGPDEMANLLRQRGWDIPEGDEVAALREMVNAEIEGARAVRSGEEAEVMTAAALMNRMDEVHAQFTEAETQAAEQFNFNDADPRYQAEIARIRAGRDAAMAEVAAEAEYPLQAEAARVAREKPNLRIQTGQDAQGRAMTVPVREFLEDASRASERAAQDAKLFDAAAACLTGAT